jgi:hypothetical protein
VGQRACARFSERAQARRPTHRCRLGHRLWVRSRIRYSATLAQVGFEEGVEISYDEPTRQLDRLVGLDRSTGFDWSKDVPAAKANFFNLVRNEHPGD